MDANTLLVSKAHAEFRKLRNGEVGDNLRAQGVEYKTIWGLESYRLKEIAAIFLADETLSVDALRDLASALWAEDVRESKMLATRLYPTDAMDESLADEWASAIQYTELADQACMNLFSRCQNAAEWVAKWIEEPSDMKRYIALQLAMRLDLTNYADLADAIARDSSEPLWLRTAAHRAATTLTCE